ncbi:MAG TPA: DUF3332 family protein [Candidatus Deferrimicrobiaceae bacterium]
MGRGRSFAAIAAVLVVAFGAMSAGCFGSFKLTKQLYDVNRSVEDKYLRSVVTWLFIIPYGFTAVLDFLIFNVVEFWSGQSPVASGPVTTVHADAGGKSILTLSLDGAATVATIERYEGGALVSTLRVRDDGSGKVTAVESTSGRAVREIKAAPGADGSVEVTVATPDGVATERHEPQAVQAGMARVARIVSETRHAVSGPGGALPVALARIPSHGG